jgi:hypothetical protein
MRLHFLTSQMHIWQQTKFTSVTKNLASTKKLSIPPSQTNQPATLSQAFFVASLKRRISSLKKIIAKIALTMQHI